MGPKTLTHVQAVLICGWQDTPFMMELLTDLDRGVDRCCSLLFSIAVNQGRVCKLQQGIPTLFGLKIPRLFSCEYAGNIVLSALPTACHW